MRICILCEDSKVDLARENTKKIFGTQQSEKPAMSPAVAKIKGAFNLPAEGGYLQIPCSSTGEYPATHWFCFMNATDAGYEKIKSVQEHTIIEESSPKEFLAKWNLQIIKSSQGS